MFKNINSILFLFVLLISFPSYGSNAQDSTLAKLESNIDNFNKLDNQAKIDSINVLTKKMLMIDPTEALTYAEYSLELSMESNYRLGIGNSLTNIAVAHRKLGDFEKAITHHEDALEIFESLNDRLGIAKILQSTAITYGYIGDYNKALEIFLEAYKLMEESGDLIGTAHSINNIGTVYLFLNEEDKALEYLLKGLEIRKQIGNNDDIAASYNNIGEVYAQIDNAEIALEYYDSALNIYKGSGRKDLALALTVNIGNGYKKLECYSVAFNYYKQGLEAASELDDKWAISSISIEIADYYLKEKEYRNALTYFKKAENLSSDINAKDLLLTSYLGLSNYHKEVKEYKKALDYHLQYAQLKDSLFNDEKSKQIAEMQTKYETEKTEQENILLKEKELFNNEKIKRQRVITISVSSFSILLLVLFLFLFRSRKVIQRKNILLTEKNNLINNQKEEILINSENLKQANEEINATNEDLKLQKEELRANIENLKSTQKQLIETAKMASLGQLTAGVAHELNNPINFIHGNVKPLKRDIQDIFEIIEKYDEIIKNKDLIESFTEVETLKTNLDFSYLIKEINDLLEGISEGSIRTSDIVKGLRNFSRLEEVEFVKADVHEIIDSTLTILNNKIKSRIEIQKDYGDINLIECMPSKLNQVFMNILNNGIEAIENKGKITIETSQKDNRLKIVIRDNGVGISNETLTHIFEPFFTTKDVGKGTGLGLSISIGIINNHNGEIDVISDVGKGTEFIIMLPIKQLDVGS